MAILVAISCAGALNGNIFVAGRLTVAAAKRGYLPGLFGEVGVLGWSGSTQGFNSRWNPGSWELPWFPRSDLRRENSVQTAWIAVPTDDEGDHITDENPMIAENMVDPVIEDRYNVPL